MARRIETERRTRLFRIAAVAALLGLAACSGDADDSTPSLDADAGGDASFDTEGDPGSSDDATPDPDASGDAPLADVGPTEPPDPRLVEPAPAEARMFRLTQGQYRATIRDIFGDDIVVPTALEPDVRSNGFFSVGAGTATISRRGVENYERAAFDIAEQAMDEERRERLLSCEPADAADAACATEILTALGLRIWRRPLAEAELNRVVAIATEIGSATGEFARGIEYAIAALLQSPSFLFRVEVGEPIPDAEGQRLLTDWEVASRMSYLLWGSTPDPTLLEAAANGELTTDDGLELHTRRMLDDDRARAGLRAFFIDYLDLEGLLALRKDPDVFFHASPDVGPAALEETLRTIEHFVLDLDADYRELFTTRLTFIDRTLAALYDVPAPAREGFAMTELPADGPRQGLLGHASFLALHSHPTTSSATQRGAFVRTRLLCGVIPPPPADVDTSLPEADATAPTLRDRVRVHLTDDVCAGCHLLMDPIGLGFEQFDGMGRYRLLENETQIDPTGDVDGSPFTDATGLGALIAAHPDLGACLVQNLFRFTHGRVEREADYPTLDTLAAWFVATGHRIEPLLVEFVMSPAFRRVADPSDDPEPAAPEGDR